MRDMTPDELAAWNGMIAGDLNALADVLDTDDDALHPILRRWLVKLIRGTARETDYRIKLDKHPDLARVSDGIQHQQLADLQSLQTALTLLSHGGLRGHWDAAVVETMSETKLGRRTVAAHWAKHKRFIQAMIARGVIQDKDPI